MYKKYRIKLLEFHKVKTECLLEKIKHIIDFNTTSSRWGFCSVLSTVFLSIVAIAIAFYAVYETENNRCFALLIFIIVIGVIGVLGVLFTAWVSLYFLRYPLKEDAPILRDIDKAVSEDIPLHLKEINTTLKEISKKIGKSDE